MESQLKTRHAFDVKGIHKNCIFLFFKLFILILPLLYTHYGQNCQVLSENYEASCKLAGQAYLLVSEKTVCLTFALSSSEAIELLNYLQILWAIFDDHFLDALNSDSFDTFRSFFNSASFRIVVQEHQITFKIQISGCTSNPKFSIGH